MISIYYTKLKNHCRKFEFFFVINIIHSYFYYHQNNKMFFAKKRIRKDENWKIRVSNVGYLQSLLFIFMPLFFWSVFVVWILQSWENIIPLYIVLILLWTFVYFGIKMFIREHNIAKAKKLKNNGWWIIKKVKITSIQHYYESWNDNRRWFDWDYLEAKDWNKFYCSDAFEWWYYAWLSNEVFQDIYGEYWYEFDEKQTHKNDVLKRINIRITEQDWKKSEWFIKRLWTERWLFILNRQKRIVERWYKSSYFQLNWHEVSVWDTVDVYIDPENENNYRMDIDFLFEK